MIKAKYPDTVVLADVKIVDGGEMERPMRSKQARISSPCLPSPIMKRYGRW
jgi:hypothetical protein